MELFSRLIALVLLILFLPLMIMISILLFLIQGRPIFYKHQRVGYNFINFQIYKFRTMIQNKGNVITQHNDNRITKIGLWLRKFKIDEIPQLINILKGEMRFIGPRPEVPDYFKENDFQFLKIIKPGISDFASILFRNEEKYIHRINSKDPYSKLLEVKIELANYYSSKKNFWLDFLLVLITVSAIVFPDISARLVFENFIPNDLIKTNKFFKNYN